MKTKIEWAEVVWNPVTGCTKVSEGCANCYAERMSKRLAGRAGYPKVNPFAVTLHEDRLEQPLGWTKPRRIFVCSMGDLFHEDINAEMLEPIYETIARCPQHTFIVLTKRPKRAALFLNGLVKVEGKDTFHVGWGPDPYPQVKWIPDNIWLGVSVESQARADERVEILREIPAAIRFISYEPALGPLGEIDLTGIGWFICGGESGPGARPMHPDWARSVRGQCGAAGVPFFLKQMGEWQPCTDPQDVYSEGMGFDTLPPEMCFKRVGKKAAGRELDGREYNEYPEVK